MPTPFMHLDSAERLLDHPQLSDGVRRALCQAWPAFYLGSIAPDVQAICNMPRALTHFHELPPALDVPSYDQMLLDFPALADVRALPLAQAVYVAGYRMHLLLDWAWLLRVVGPFFWQTSRWDGTPPQERRMAHFILLTYLDSHALGRLPDSAESTLGAAQPAGWTPFVADADMQQWQAMITDQLKPGRPIRTVEIYAERLHMTPDVFAARLHDDAWLTSQLFERVPLAPVETIIDAAIDSSVGLISDYLAPILPQ
jgi:hypothetical protein